MVGKSGVLSDSEDAVGVELMFEAFEVAKKDTGKDRIG
jgi:hypothetical protein